MQDLLFLGQIPFTNLYISFWAWLGFVVVATPLTWAYHNRRSLESWLLAAYVAWLIRRHHLVA